MTSRIFTLPENTAGRDFVVGDIHGAFDLLDKALLAVGFDPAKDRLIAVGDLINRGDRSHDCLDYLAQPWFHSIRGNHEDIFIRAHRKGKFNDPAVISRMPPDFAWALNETEEMREVFCAAFEKLPIALEIMTAEGPVGFVHGDVPEGMDWSVFKKNILADDLQVLKTAIWSRDRIETGNDSGVAGALRVFFGHTTVSGGPKALGNCLFIDTGAIYKFMDENHQSDLYMTIIDIKANAADICNPAPTQEKLIRTVTVKKSGPKT
jgi:serine/threonine protein phosphatase 1